jgi:hypothetical protein
LNRIREQRAAGDVAHQENKKYWCRVCRGWHLTSQRG